MGPVATDTSAVQQQIIDLNDLKKAVHPKQLEIQTLNQTAKELIKESPTDQHAAVKEPVSEVNKRWDILLDNIGTREVKLKKVLLNLGEFDSTIGSMLDWLHKTDRDLDQLEPVGGDPKLIEMEIGKLRVSDGWGRWTLH